MALCATNISPRSLNFLLRRYCANKQICKYSSQKCLLNEINPLENFTTQLMQNKIDKWNKRSLNKTENAIHSIEIKNAEPASSLYAKPNMDFGLLKADEINYLFQEAEQLDDYDRIIFLTKECLKYGKCPIMHILFVLKQCAQRGDIHLILRVEQFCRENHPKFLQAHSNFKHLLAEATWVRGDIPKSLKLIEEVYANNCFLRKKLRITLKLLITDTVSKRSEAVLMNLVNFTNKLFLEYGDIFPLMYLWQVCILSEWFSDQNLALNLLETNPKLRQAVINKLQYVAVISLYNHKTDMVYRLLEILLQNEMKFQYSGVLLALLDYQIHQGHISRCMEIINWSKHNDVNISSGILNKFIILLLSKNNDVPIVVKQQNAKIKDFKF